MPANSRRTPWSCSPRAPSATPRRRPGERPSGPRPPWCWQGPARGWISPRSSGWASGRCRPGDEAVRQARLVGRYYTRQVQLHGECFYNGLCDPGEDTERRIRKTSGYIGDAERLADDLPEDQPDVLQDSLSIIFGVDIIRVIKHRGDPPEYYMETAQGNITLGTIDKIYSQTKFRQAVGTATGIVIQKVPGNIWEQRVQAILSACEEIEAGEGILRERETRPLDRRLPAGEAAPGGGLGEGRRPQESLREGRHDPHVRRRLPPLAGSSPGAGSWANTASAAGSGRSGWSPSR